VNYRPKSSDRARLEQLWDMVYAASAAAGKSGPEKVADAALEALSSAANMGAGNKILRELQRRAQAEKDAAENNNADAAQTSARAKRKDRSKARGF
jgi:hypothetical protein